MNERTQRALDGEIGRAELSTQERHELAWVEAAIRVALQTVPVEPIPDLAPAVLERLAHAHASDRSAVNDVRPRASAPTSRLASIVGWVWRPRAVSLRWRPAYVMAAAAAAVTLALGLRRNEASAGGTLTRVLTQFAYTAPNAQNVAVAGDFSGWQPSYPMQRTERGLWIVVVPLPPGVHDYAFVIDGQRWVPDPMAPSYDDGFGGRNSRLAVLASDDGRIP